MKRFTILAMLIVMVSITFAQTHMYVWKNGVKTNYAISEVDSITFGEEETQKQVIGVFSVSADKQVIFSKGNLHYNPALRKWKFAENQYDYIGDLNSNISNNYNGWIDLFGFGTGDNPAKSSPDFASYGTFVDWGTNIIGYDARNTWRTLTYMEWYYLLYNRPNHSALIGIAEVNGINGLILLPDNYICPSNIAFKSGFHNLFGIEYYSGYQTFTQEDWLTLENAGAIFLPTCGLRDDGNIENIMTHGYYWSATKDSNLYYAHCFFFTSNSSDVHLKTRDEGCSVRLVKDVQIE